MIALIAKDVEVILEWHEGLRYNIGRDSPLQDLKLHYNFLAKGKMQIR